MDRIKIPLLIIAFLALSALTPAERKIVEHARQELSAGRAEHDKAVADVAAAQQRTSEAEASAKVTADKIGPLEKQIEDAHKHESDLAKQVNDLKKEHDQVHSYWGLGGVLLGFSILAKHLFITILVILGIGIALYVASFFFPVIGVGLGIVRAFLGSLWTRIKALLHRP